MAVLLNHLAELVRSRAGRFRANTRANVAVLFALSLPILVGGLGLSAEATYWYVDQRAMQNASDAAALAAATDQPNRVLLKGLAKENFRRGVLCAVVPPMGNSGKVRADLWATSNNGGW